MKFLIERIANKTVDAVWEDINDRRGLRQQIDQMDEDIKEEIKLAWRTAFIKILSTSLLVDENG